MTVVSSTSITATTPAHAAGAVSVVVTNTDAQAGTLTNGYTYTTSNPAPTVSSISPKSGTARGDRGDHHGHGLPGGSDGEAGRNGGDGGDGGEQHIDYGHDSGARGGSGECGGDQHGCQSGTLNNGYTYTSQSGADGELDLADVGNDGRGNAVTITGTGFLSGATVSWGHGGDRRDRREQHVDYCHDSGARRGCGECGGDQHGQPERHVDQRLHLHNHRRRGQYRICAGEFDDTADTKCVGTLTLSVGADGGEPEHRGGGMERHYLDVSSVS